MFDALAEFVIFCRVERRLADRTCLGYERDVRACLEFLGSEGPATLEEVRTPHLRRFLAEEASHRPAPSSQARSVAALRRAAALILVATATRRRRRRHAAMRGPVSGASASRAG